MTEFSLLPFHREELFTKAFWCFPYPIQVYAPDGTSVMVNRAMIDEYHVSSPDAIIGKYNIFKDPYIAASGQIETLKRAFQGETVFFSNIKVPINEISEQYGIYDFDVEAIYQDITLFPILDDEKQVKYVAALLINRRVYHGKAEIEKARQYIENNWLDRFDLNKTANAVCLSRAHFAKLFKKHTGVTPHEHYTVYKINRLKEKLLDVNLSVAEAFSACNMDYNGHTARVFKEKTGLSPSDYRKISGNKGEKQ